MLLSGAGKILRARTRAYVDLVERSTGESCGTPPWCACTGNREESTMRILYVSDGERRGVMTLDQLVTNINENDGWKFRHNEDDMRDELESRGWYEGENDFGRYLVLNLAKLDIEPIPETSRPPAVEADRATETL